MGAAQGINDKPRDVAVDPDRARTAAPGEAEVGEHEHETLEVMSASRISGSILPQSGKSSGTVA
jgi:hypothetical protein